MQSTPSVFRDQVVHPEGHDDGHGHHGLAHVVPPIILLGVFAVLMVLTIITVAVTKFDFGYQWNLIIALSIAVVKAMLVIGYFMHLRYDSLFYTAIVGICLVFIAVFILFAIIDTSNYAPLLHPQPVQAAS